MLRPISAESSKLNVNFRLAQEHPEERFTYRVSKAEVPSKNATQSGNVGCGVALPDKQVLLAI